MQLIELLSELWSDILIDFVIGLLLFKDSAIGLFYNAILVIVDRFTKYALIIPFQQDYTAV
jgi:hypothetical protein